VDRIRAKAEAATVIGAFIVIFMISDRTVSLGHRVLRNH